MTDNTDPAPPATRPPKTRDDYYREWSELEDIVRNMYQYAPSKLAGATLILRSMMNATEDEGRAQSARKVIAQSGWVSVNTVRAALEAAARARPAPAALTLPALSDDQVEYLRNIEAQRYRPNEPCPKCGAAMKDHIIGGPGPYHPKPVAAPAADKPANCRAPNCNPADALEGRCCGWMEYEPQASAAEGEVELVKMLERFETAYPEINEAMRRAAALIRRLVQERNEALEIAAKIVETLPAKVLPTQDGYDGTITQELCEPSRHGFAKAIRAAQIAAQPKASEEAP